MNAGASSSTQSSKRYFDTIVKVIKKTEQVIALQSEFDAQAFNMSKSAASQASGETLRLITDYEGFIE